MGLDSVVTVVHLRGDDGKHLALGARDRGVSKHDLAIHPHGFAQCLGVEALNGHDLPQPTRRLGPGLKDPIEEPVGMFGCDLVDVGHD